MHKILNLVMFLIIITFTFTIYKYYSSNKNINIKDYNRSNIDQILKNKISNLPVLENDTENVIEFNNSLESEINDTKKRSFWDLIKNK
tara:strand:- start:680 stop:943 length:264 start_codon:yes stop_codon:yes gene_type:complete